MTFQKGQSGNPKGRPPRSQDFTEVLRAKLDELRRGSTTRQQIAAVAVEKALRGDMDAIRWIVDRTDGKVPDRVDATVDAHHEHSVPEATLDAVLGYYAAKRGAGNGPA